MKILNLIYLLIFLIIMVGGVRAQSDSLLLTDDFTSTEKFTDLSTKLIWSDSGDTTSGFLLNQVEDSKGTFYNCLSLTQEAIEKTGYKEGTIKASQAIDYILPKKFDRLDATYKIEFDALWEELNNSGWGESGRIVVTLLHDYPQEIPFNAIYDLQKETPFGRPAYNLRIRNHNQTGTYYSGAFMLYGGGHDVNGEIEIYNNSYWLPGFSSEAGGTTPGLSDSYPLSPTMKNENFVAVAYPDWKHYTWLIKPERLEFYIRESFEEASQNELVFFMQIPKTNKTEIEIIEEINTAHQSSVNDLPVLYNWFRWVEAIRVYFRGSEQTHLANFSVSEVTDAPLAVKEGNNQNSAPKVYPNPCNVSFNIETRSAHEAIYALYNLNGTMVKNGTINHPRAAQAVNVETLPSGIYLLKTTQQRETNIQKIIINK